MLSEMERDWYQGVSSGAFRPPYALFAFHVAAPDLEKGKG